MNQSYESFNARNYTPSEVAKTFVSCTEYEDLWRNEHAIILGPRGSGKTTLFKMLTVGALYSWESSIAVELRKKRAFTAIYVPADMHWHHQLKRAEDALPRAPRLANAISLAAVTTSVLLGVARAFEDLLKFERKPTGNEEADLCSRLITQWLLPNTLPNLPEVILALKGRIAAIRASLNSAISRRVSDEASDSLPGYYHFDYLAQLDLACSSFDVVFGNQEERKWALCFDELELAPVWLQSLAFSQQRSSEQNVLLKISTSPIPRCLGTTDARPKQDLRLITLWNHAGRRGDDFDERLATSYLKRTLGREFTTASLLGSSDLVEESSTGIRKYERGSAEWSIFKDLASWDVGFANVLQAWGLNPADPYTPDISVRDSLLRKVKPIVLYRSALLKASGDKVVLRSRKVGSMYYGREALYRVADGNPRRLIGILGDLCSRVSATEKVTRISASAQAEILAKASLAFGSYIQALPAGSSDQYPRELDLFSLLRTIGFFFRHRLLSKVFPVDPVGSVIVDSNVSDATIELLRHGVYHGALVLVDPGVDVLTTSLRGKRLRLSYMLAPMYKLPLTLYDPVSLLMVLRQSSAPRVRRSIPTLLEQPQLGI